MSKGIIEKLPFNENVQPETIHYLPHRAVVKSERETTKVRALFDAFRKQPDETSLKVLLSAGQCLLPKFYDVKSCVFNVERLRLLQTSNKRF